MVTRSSRRITSTLSTFLSIGGIAWLLPLSLSASANWYNGQTPCPAHGENLGVDNQQVLQWKQSEPNGYRTRAHVLGYVVGQVPDRNGHDHFIIQIGKAPSEVLEVVYNQEFGALPNIENGMQVEACGDFIQSYAQNGPYPPSPAGAIIHWVHVNPHLQGNGHDSGYLIINGQMYGTEISNGSPYSGRNGSRGNPMVSYPPQGMGGSYMPFRPFP